MTRHATGRLKERIGIPKRAAKAHLADLTQMMPQAEAGGRFRRYLDRMGIQHGSSFCMGPNDEIYALKGNAVTTVMVVPVEHRKQYRNQFAKWKASRNAPEPTPEP